MSRTVATMRTRPTPTMARPAFTLMECVIAVIIIGVATPAMFFAMRNASLDTITNLQVSRACWLAQEKLEDVIADRHSTTRGYAYVFAANYPAEPTLTGFPGFTRSVTIGETGATLTGSGTGYKKITVTVTYPDWSGATRSFAVQTIVTNYTP